MGPPSTASDVLVEMKSAYALTFLGLCAIVLLVHVNHNENAEAMKEAEDPFLATLEARVVAKAQARLARSRAKRASKEHISAVRQAIRDSLNAAAETSESYAEEEQLDSMREDAKAMGLAQTKKNTKKKTPAKVAVKKHSSEKKYTWDELQAGADAPASTHKTVAQKAAVTRMAQEKA